jgi:hypothetical protein
MGMQPNSKIRELHAKVQAEYGVSGKFWPVSIEADCDETEPLCPESTMQECGLFHKAVVWLELETRFCAERDTLIALRDACMQHFVSPASRWARSSRPEVSEACLAWSHLESFTSPEQLATCRGVKVFNGHVTELYFNSLTGNIKYHRQFALSRLSNLKFSRPDSKGNWSVNGPPYLQVALQSAGRFARHYQ